MPPTNQAAWLTAKSANPLEVKPAPYTAPGTNEIVIKNGAIAVNPVDWVKQVIGDLALSWIPYPFILGSDVAGEVVEVGKEVKRFKVGDRVVGNAVGADKRSNKASEGAFQLYTVLRTNITSPIPDSMSYEEACVLPLALSTASCGLFMKDQLALQPPSLNPKPTGLTLLIWGGSTSVGSNAIQLAVAAGYEVITTCSPKNYPYVRKLGASQAFDYNSPTVQPDIIAAMKPKKSAGAFAIGDGAASACISILAAVPGRKYIALASTVPLPTEMPSGIFGLIGMAVPFVWGNAKVFTKSSVKRVPLKFIWGSDNMANEVGALVYEDFLPAALAQGKYIAAPEPMIVGKGLEKIQEALDVNKKGVSAKKVIITL